MKKIVLAAVVLVGTAFASNAQAVNENKVVKKPQVVHVNERVHKDNVLVRESHPVKANVEDKRHLHTPNGKPYKQAHKHEVKQRQRHQAHVKKAVK